MCQPGTVFDLQRAPALTDEQWAVVCDHMARAGRARQAEDWPLLVGCAKELVESVARFALGFAGVTVSNREGLRGLVNAAHGVLERPEAEELASDLPTAKIVKQMQNAVCELAELRNALGTGHGSATQKATLEEHADVAMDAAATWCRWATRRLGVVMFGQHVVLIGDLRGAASFYRHTLRDRLRAVNLPMCSEQEQHSIGVAVGRRAAGGTFMVREEGVEAATTRGSEWPLAYRLGVIEGLLLTEDGFLRSDAHAVRFIPALAADANQWGEHRLGEVIRQVELSDVSYLNSPSQRQDIARALREADHGFTSHALAALLRVSADQFEGGVVRRPRASRSCARVHERLFDFR